VRNAAVGPRALVRLAAQEFRNDAGVAHDNERVAGDKRVLQSGLERGLATRRAHRDDDEGALSPGFQILQRRADEVGIMADGDLVHFESDLV